MLKLDVDIAAKLLPYLVQDVLVHRLVDPSAPGIAAVNVRNEILAVLTDKWSAQDTPALGDQTGDDAGDRKGSGSATQHKCTQAVFSLLDTLKQWNKPSRVGCANRRARRCGRLESLFACTRCDNTCRTGNHDNDAVLGHRGFMWLMGQIPAGLLAEAAARCRAHARCVGL